MYSPPWDLSLGVVSCGYDFKKKREPRCHQSCINPCFSQKRCTEIDTFGPISIVHVRLYILTTQPAVRVHWSCCVGVLRHGSPDTKFTVYQVARKVYTYSTHIPSGVLDSGQGSFFSFFSRHLQWVTPVTKAETGALLPAHCSCL